MEPDREALIDEEKRLKRLKFIIDLTSAVIRRTDLPLDDAQKLIADTKEKALELFPDKEETFDLIYGARFRRILSEKYRLQ
jgi:hypothetical protein